MIYRLLFVGVILLACVAAASAQEPAKIEVVGAYSFTRQVGDARFENPDRNGFEVSATIYPVRWLGIEAAYTEHFGDESVAPGVLFPGGDGPRPEFEIDTRLTSFMVGPKIALRTHRVMPYAHALFGGERQRTTLRPVGFPETEQRDGTFGLTLGGGVNLRLTDRVLVRLAQIDYVRADIDFTEQQNGVLLRSSTSPNQVRASIGIGLTF